MKKSSQVCITLHRETLLSLAAPAMEAVQGGATSAIPFSVVGSCVITRLTNCAATTAC